MNHFPQEHTTLVEKFRSDGFVALPAGGANFPLPVWDTEKVWRDGIHVLVKDGDLYTWKKGGKLPHAVAYGAAVMFWMWKCTAINGYLYTASGICSCVISGQLVSCVFGRPIQNLSGLTIYTLNSPTVDSGLLVQPDQDSPKS